MSMSEQAAHAISGAAAGVVSLLVTYPLITVSSRLQVKVKASSNSDNATLSSPPSADTATAGTLSAILQISRAEGIASLFSGVHSAMLGISVTNFVYYAIYEHGRSSFSRTSGRKTMSAAESIVAGAFAGAAAVLATNPIWIVQTRMMVRARTTSQCEKQAPPPSAWETLTQMVSEEGILSLAAGLAPALLLVSHPVLHYTIFEQLRSHFDGLRDFGKHHAIAPTPTSASRAEVFITSAVAKLISTTLTYPILLLKSRMQIASNRANKDGTTPSMWTEIKSIYAADGWRGFFVGLRAKLWASVLASGILFTAKDDLYRVIMWALAQYRRTLWIAQ
ncbi:mitochondrial carrier domain-containing protein [Blastocladiella britannica]|nr:mitochondrial carrier domain-containing protein [Blastocladiella britannica]